MGLFFFRGAVEIEAVFQLLTLMRIWEPTGAQQSVGAGASLAAPINLCLVWTMPLAAIPKFLPVLGTWSTPIPPGRGEEMRKRLPCIPRKVLVGAGSSWGSNSMEFQGKWS